MSARHACFLLCLLSLLAPASRAADERPANGFGRRASWSIPTVEAVKQQVFEYLADDAFDDATRVRAQALWESAANEGNDGHLLDLVAATAAEVDPQAEALVDFCARGRTQVALPDVLWLVDEKSPVFVRANLRLVYARWLVQESLYDEALEQLRGLSPGDVVDPAALLFYEAVVQHRLLAKNEALAAIGKLMERETEIPRRYVSVARLMRADIEDLKDDSLDHIARRMDDIRRRLDLGRAGPKVRSVEDGVIASLDKLIEEMEKQQQAAAAAAAAAQKGGGQQQLPSNPLPDSMPMELKGEGKVANKPVGDSSGWGDLPPRERDEALQQIGKEFPAHYRDMIEQYFRKLAADPDETPDK
jgi:hypothetical protein